MAFLPRPAPALTTASGEHAGIRTQGTQALSLEIEHGAWDSSSVQPLCCMGGASSGISSLLELAKGT